MREGRERPGKQHVRTDGRGCGGTKAGSAEGGGGGWWAVTVGGQRYWRGGSAQAPERESWALLPQDRCGWGGSMFDGPRGEQAADTRPANTWEVRGDRWTRPLLHPASLLRNRVAGGRPTGCRAEWAQSAGSLGSHLPNPRCGSAPAWGAPRRDRLGVGGPSSTEVGPPFSLCCAIYWNLNCSSGSAKAPQFPSKIPRKLPAVQFL